MVTVRQPVVVAVVPAVPDGLHIQTLSGLQVVPDEVTVFREQVFHTQTAATPASATIITTDLVVRTVRGAAAAEATEITVVQTAEEEDPEL